MGKAETTGKMGGKTRRTRGSVMVMVAFGILAMAGAMGLAVDVGRAQMAQSKLSSALDAAGLAAGTNLDNLNVEDEVRRYLDANFAGYMDATITDVTVEVSESNAVVNLSAHARLRTSMMQYFGFDEMDVEATSQITRATSGLELVMALDNTGSMAGASLTALKEAATDLVNILHGDGTAQNLYIGLVPFSQAVNIGASRTSWVDAASLSAKNWGTTTWGGCVDARLNGYDTTDDTPSTHIFYPYYWPDDANNDWITTTTTTKKGKTTTTTTYTINASKGPNKNCPQALLPMTSDKQTVLNAINSMQAVGNTHIGLGAVWAWRMLSPKWRGLWGGEMDQENLPLDYNTEHMNKAVIIMTDGENTMSNTVRTAYWYLSDGRLGTANGTTAVANLNTRLTSVCNAMKGNDRNIIVYTIAFGNPGTGIENLLKSCATTPEYYFDTPNTTELRKAFRQIGDSLSNLRVSQ